MLRGFFFSAVAAIIRAGNAMEVLEDIIRGTLVVICHTVSLYLMSEPKPSIRHPLLFWVLSSVPIEAAVCLIFTFEGFTFQSGGVVYFILLFVYLALFLFSSAGLPARNLFLVLMYMTFFMLAAAISNFIGSTFFDDNAIAISAFRTCFSAVFIVIYPLKLREPFHKATDDIDKGWGILIFFEMIALASISFLSFIGAFIINDPGAYLILLMIVSFLLISAYIVVVRMIGLMNERNFMQALQAQQSILEYELDSEKDAVEASRRYRHDMKHHSKVVQSYLEEGRYDEAASYLRELDGYISGTSLPVFCDNGIVNALFRMYSRRLAGIGGTFRISASVPDDLPVSRTDLAVIFGNLLENAADACSAVSSPLLEVKAFVQNRSLMVEIRNTMTGTICWKNDLPATTKEYGGTGLKSVVRTLGKYGGMLSVEQDGDVFISRVIIPIGS